MNKHDKRVFKTKKGNRIIGIALPEITFLLLSLVIFIFCAADMVESFWLGLGGCIFALFVFVLFNLDMPSGISRIKDYLEKQFKSEYDWFNKNRVTVLQNSKSLPPDFYIWKQMLQCIYRSLCLIVTWPKTIHRVGCCIGGAKNSPKRKIILFGK